MPTTTDIIDEKEFAGLMVVLRQRKEFELTGRGGIGKTIWVNVFDGEAHYASRGVNITDRFDRSKDNLHMEPREILGAKRISDIRISVTLRASPDYELEASKQ